MDNVEFGGSEQVPGHRRHSNNNFKFDSLNLDEVSPADHESMSSHPSGSSIWPANVYMEVAQPPTQIWQQSSPTLGSRYHRLNSDSRVHSESSNHHQQIMSPDRSNLVRPTLISRRTLAADTNYDFQHQPHMYEESASSLVARSANESPVAVNESPISNRRDESIVSLPDQNKRVLKQLLHSSRRPVEAESQRITQTRPTAQQVAFTVNDQTASSIELITRKPTQHSVPVLKSTNQTPSSRIVPSDHNWPFTTSFGSKIDHKVIVSSNSTSNPISEKQSTTSNPIRFDNSEIRNQN